MRYLDLTRYLDTAHYNTVFHGTSDLDAESQLPKWLDPLQGWFKCFIGHVDMPWYRLGDLGAEVEAMQSCKSRKVDIIHFMDGEHSAQFLPRRIKEMGLSRIKTVATFHQPPDLLPQLVNEKMLNWLDAIILMSPTQVPFFKSRVSEDKLHVILLGVDSELFHPSPVRRENDQVACITTGLHLRDWETFKKVACAAPDITFVVVTSSRVKFENIPNLKLYSGVSDAELAELYRSADILFLPLIDATANNTLLEGIASGLPVVATDHKSVRAYLPDEGGIFIADNRVEGFVDALRRLQNDPALRRKMGQQARARAEELSWTSIIKQYDALYRQLHAGQNSTSPASAHDDTEVRLQTPSPKGSWTLKERFQQQSISAANGDMRDMDVWGYALLEAGLREEAAALFSGLSKSVPDGFVGYAGQAYLAADQWNWSEAIAAVDNCLTAAPTETQPRLISMKAKYLVQIGELPKAKEILLSIEKDFEGLLTLARVSSLDSAEEANKYWETCVAQFPDQLEGFLGQAAELIACGNYAEADAILTHAMGIWPNALAAKLLWARCATNARNMHAAGARWAAVMAERGCDRDLPTAYAHHLGLIGDRVGAEAYLRSCEPPPAAAADFLVEYYSASGDLKMAIQHAQKLSSLRQDDIAARLREAALHMRQGSSEGLHFAEKSIRSALTLAPQAAIVKAELVEILIRLGMDEEAKKILQTINPADRRAQFEVLRLWAILRDNDDAAGVQYWKNMFLDIGALAATKNFSADLRITDRFGFY